MLVTGASGGVGRTAIAILLERGYETWASTGKPQVHDDLLALGVAGIVGRDEVTAESARPLETERWAAAVDCVGGATLPYLLRTLRYGGAIAASGNTGGAAFATTVFPFILRGAALLGIDSAALPIAERRSLWERLATDYRPRGLGDRVTEVTLEVPARGARRDPGRPGPRALAGPGGRMTGETGGRRLGAEHHVGDQRP